MLVGAFTWPPWPSQKIEEQKEKEETWEVMADLEEAPEIEDGEGYADDERSEENKEEEQPRNIRADGGPDDELPPEEREEMEIAEEIGQRKKPFGMDLIMQTGHSNAFEKSQGDPQGHFKVLLAAEGRWVSSETDLL